MDFADSIIKNFEHHASFAASHTPGMQVLREAGLTFIDSGLPCDTFNVIHINQGEQLTRAALEQACAYYRDRKLPFCIWVCDTMLTSAVREIFQALHLAQHNVDVGMFLAMEAYQPVSDANHASIRLVDDWDSLRAFSSVVSANWSPPDEQVMRYYELTSDVHLMDSNPGNLAVYWIDGQPVGAIEMCPSDQDVVGIYGVATLQSHRRKGIGSSLMTFMLNRARKRGYRYAVLQASEDGLNIYTRSGFRPVTHYYEYA